MTPTDKQYEALMADDFAVLFGGALGGGKTEWLLQCVSLFSERYPGCRMGFVRRNYKELMQSGGPLDRAEELWAAQAGVAYRKAEKVFIAANGSRVEFRHCERNGDQKHFQGSEYDFIMIDEGGLFLPDMLTYFMERLRGKRASGYRITANPGGVGHDWLNRVFRLNPLDGFRFIPSLASDNPHLPQGYYDRLELTMTGIDKRHRLYGEWDADSDIDFFGEVQIYDDYPDTVTNWVRAWDTAVGGDNTVGTLVGREPASGDGQSVFWVVDQIVRKTRPHELTALIEKTHKDEPDVQVLVEQEPGSSSAAYIYSLEFAKGLPTDKNKAVRARTTAGHMGKGRVKFVRGNWTKDLVNEMRNFTGEKGGKDDRVDSMVHGVNYLARGETQLWGF